MASRKVTVGTPTGGGRCAAGDNTDKLTVGKQGLERVAVRGGGVDSDIVEEVVMDDEGGRRRRTTIKPSLRPQTTLR